MTTTDLSTYDQAVAFQTALVNRAVLRLDQVHEVEDADENALGTVWLRCSCSQWIRFRAEDADLGEQMYVGHVREKLQMAVAA